MSDYQLDGFFHYYDDIDERFYIAYLPDKGFASVFRPDGNQMTPLTGESFSEFVRRGMSNEQISDLFMESEVMMNGKMRLSTLLKLKSLADEKAQELSSHKYLDKEYAIQDYNARFEMALEYFRKGMESKFNVSLPKLYPADLIGARALKTPLVLASALDGLMTGKMSADPEETIYQIKKDGQVIRDNSLDELFTVGISPETRQLMRQVMYGIASHGTAVRLNGVRHVKTDEGIKRLIRGSITTKMEGEKDKLVYAVLAKTFTAQGSKAYGVGAGIQTADNDYAIFSFVRDYAKKKGKRMEPDQQMVATRGGVRHNLTSGKAVPYAGQILETILKLDGADVISKDEAPSYYVGEELVYPMRARPEFSRPIFINTESGLFLSGDNMCDEPINKDEHLTYCSVGGELNEVISISRPVKKD